MNSDAYATTAGMVELALNQTQEIHLILNEAVTTARQIWFLSYILVVRYQSVALKVNTASMVVHACAKTDKSLVLGESATVIVILVSIFQKTGILIHQKT